MKIRVRFFLSNSLYRKYGVIGKKKANVKYVVAKKFQGGKARPSSGKGPYKVVDKRLKKDKRAAKNRGKNNKNKQANSNKKRKQQRPSKSTNKNNRT